MKSSTTMENNNVKQLKGDGLRVTMDLNDLNLEISGDGCRVSVTKNCGKIRVIGDGCSLKVNRNEGDIEYKGDGGSIFLGGGSRTESVSYEGDGGRISVKGTNDKSSEGSNRSGNIKVKKSGKKKSNDHCNDESKSFKCSFSDSELEVNLENLLNENKETVIRDKKNIHGIDSKTTTTESRNKDKNLRRSKTIVVTKISASTTVAADQIPVNINNNFIQSLFRSSAHAPNSVIRNLNKSNDSGPKSL